jgi:hypothetical protein
MAQPTPLIERCVLQGVTHRAEQLLEHRERKPHASLTIGRSRDSHLRQMSQMRTGGIAMKNLDEKELHRDDRIEQTLSPRMADIATGTADSIGLKLTRPILLKLFDHLTERLSGNQTAPSCLSQAASLR